MRGHCMFVGSCDMSGLKPGPTRVLCRHLSFAKLVTAQLIRPSGDLQSLRNLPALAGCIHLLFSPMLSAIVVLLGFPLMIFIVFRKSEAMLLHVGWLRTVSLSRLATLNGRECTRISRIQVRVHPRKSASNNKTFSKNEEVTIGCLKDRMESKEAFLEREGLTQGALVSDVLPQDRQFLNQECRFVHGFLRHRTDESAGRTRGDRGN